MEKIKFKDLSWGLKIPIVSAWIVGILYALSILVGFIAGMLEV